MTNSPREAPVVDLFRQLAEYGRKVARVAVAAGALAAAIGLVYYFWLQPVRHVTALEFRPTFDGASAGRYPNGLPFAASDIIGAPILDLVYDANKLSDYCPRLSFQSGFFIEQQSDASAMLDAEYQARLSETRLTTVERERLQAEYQAKRRAIPAQFRLVFIRPEVCTAIPQMVLSKAMSDIMSTWASESETRRGVLNQQVEVLTPAILDVGEGTGISRLLRADLVRTALWRVIRNIDQVAAIPGAAVIRGPSGLAFGEVRSRLVDLVRARLEPVIVGAGRAMAGESVGWITETIASVEREVQAAEGRALAIQNGLQDYSGATPAPAVQTTGASGSTSDVQTLSPQIDRTFIDRIIEMSEANTTFRQTLTQSMIQARIQAVDAQERASYYRRLLESLRQSSGTAVSAADLDVRVGEIAEEGKALTRQFNELYAQFSQMSLRAAAAMFQVERPVTSEVYRGFGLPHFFLLVFSAMAISALTALAAFAVGDRLRGRPSS